MYRISDELAEFVESGVAVVIGTGDAHGRPHVAYGWGPRIGADRTSLELFVDRGRAEDTLSDLEATGRIAVTFAAPVSYRSVQLKGRVTAWAEPDGDDRAWVQRHREAFLSVTALIGDPPAVIRSMWTDDIVRVALTVEQAFDQTPGPQAGTPL